MRIEITGRQIEVTPALREFAAEKLRKLEKLLDGDLEAHVVLAVEKHRHMAEIQVKSRTAVLSATEETGDLYASISEVADKLERQALRHKDKVTGRKRREGVRAADAALALDGGGGEVASTDPEVLHTRIIRSHHYRLKPLTPEDAVLELDVTGDELLVYRDADTDRVNVIFRRKDGNFDLVDPEF